MSKETTTRPMGRRGHGPMGGGRPVVKAKDFSGTMKKLIRFMKPYYPVIILAVLFAAVGQILAILGPKILGKATTELAEGFMRIVYNTGTIDFDYILKIILILVGMYIISGILSYIMSIMMATITQKTAYKLRKDISEKILTLLLMVMYCQELQMTLIPYRCL